MNTGVGDAKVDNKRIAGEGMEGGEKEQRLGEERGRKGEREGGGQGMGWT